MQVLTVKDNHRMKILIILIILWATPLWANSLTLHVIPSPKGIDWSTPSSLMQSLVKNGLTFKPRIAGHVIVEIKCGDEHELTGMVGKNFNYFNQLLFEHSGLGILFQSFEGTLEGKDKISPELKEYQKTGASNFIQFELNPNQCQRDLQYFKEFRDKNVGLNYGLPHRPRFGEGASSSAFGVSFLDVLNLVDQDMKESWEQTLQVPLSLAGPPVKDEGVGIFKVIFNAGSWSQKNQPHRSLTFINPDLIHKWISNKAKSPTGDYRAMKIEMSQGVSINKSHFPAPQEGIWLQRLDPLNNKKTLD